MNASPPMTPPTIAPVLLAEAVGSFGSAVFDGKFSVGEIFIEGSIELVGDNEVDKGVGHREVRDGFGVVEGAAGSV